MAALVVMLTACTTSVTGVPIASGGVVNREDPDAPEGVDPLFIQNTDGGEIDRLAATVIKDVEKYWQESFPQVFGKQFEPLRGGYYSVDTAHSGSPAPPCTDKASDVEGNAFYCPTADAIAWDRAALLPVLRDQFGEAAVMLVLAHEMGHAVQRRTGLTPAAERANPRKFPTILIEAMADCYAGSFVRYVVDKKADHLRLDRTSLDTALESLVTFRDPVGTSQSAEGAHGDAFDRVSAFQDGFDQGAKLCSEMTVENRTFTQRSFTTTEDRASGGNMAFTDMFEPFEKDVNAYFEAEVRKLGKQWPRPKLEQVTTTPSCSPGDQGPVAYCQDGGTVEVTTKGKLPEIHKSIGDWSTGTIMASRYGMATLAAFGKPLTGRSAQEAVLCLSGAYTGFLLNRTEGDYTLSPGDLDESVQVLLRFDYSARDLDGKAPATGFERVTSFRTGAVGGFSACRLG
jgi:predicted metalloprotease